MFSKYVNSRSFNINSLESKSWQLNVAHLGLPGPVWFLDLRYHESHPGWCLGPDGLQNLLIHRHSQTSGVAVAGCLSAGCL